MSTLSIVVSIVMSMTKSEVQGVNIMPNCRARRLQSSRDGSLLREARGELGV